MFEQLIKKLQDPKKSYITLETTPRHDALFTPVIETIDKLGIAKKVDGFSTTDNPLAKLKFNSIIAAHQLQQTFKKPTLATMTMRDRNKIALQSDLLGANSIDVRAILALTGDPAKISDQPQAKGVFESDSTMLLDIIKCFNAGIDYAGREFGIKPRPIYPFAVSNAFAKNPNTLLKKFIKKLDHGALGVITQPVFERENALMLLELFEEAKIKSGNRSSTLILGIFPVTRLKTAQFLASHVPGIHVPKNWIDALYEAQKKSEKEEERVGLALSREIFGSVREFHPKIHLMTANRFSLAQKLLEE
ncbi:methylenetetrahydrofolate reductase [Hydrogenimonas urashimensis]|uniref:methylenetetrahydrofolate reductase n=1 Tax=Hydrogenimonas urashimensis TaxID=2740515 RepID=UPI00191566CC|nr:methylenetetrahydrofolate reductase [Hydrogenimonas urashimensis]